MDIEKLKAFYFVAKTGSFTKASKIIFLTQPAVTKKVQLLERELGVKLFERLGNKIFLTEAGKTLISHVEKIFNTISKAKEDILRLKNPLYGKLNFGTSSIPGIHVVPFFLNKFKSLYPYINISVKMAYSKKIYKMIKDNIIDFGIIEEHGEETDPKFEIIPLLYDVMVLVTPKNDFFLKKRNENEYIYIKDIKNENIIFTEKESALRNYLNTSLIAKELVFDSYPEYGNVEAAKNLIKMGFGVGLLPYLAVSEEIKNGTLLFFKLKDIIIKRKVILIYLKGKDFSNPTNLFINYVKNNLSDFVKANDIEDFVNII